MGFDGLGDAGLPFVVRRLLRPHGGAVELFLVASALRFELISVVESGC